MRHLGRTVMSVGRCYMGSCWDGNLALLGKGLNYTGHNGQTILTGHITIAK